MDGQTFLAAYREVAPTMENEKEDGRRRDVMSQFYVKI